MWQRAKRVIGRIERGDLLTLLESTVPVAPHSRSGMTGSKPSRGDMHANTPLKKSGKWKIGSRGRHVRESVRSPSQSS